MFDLRKTSANMLNVFLVISAIVTGVAAVITVIISIKKEQISDAQRKLDMDRLHESVKKYDSLNEKYKNEIKVSQYEISLAQSKYDLLNQKYKDEILLQQSKYDLLTQKYISESSQKITSRIVGEKSMPAIKFGSYNSQTNQAYLYIANSGEDPAYGVNGFCQHMLKKVGPKVGFGPIDVPINVVNYNFAIDMEDESEAMIFISFTTLYGYYHEILIVRFDGKQYRQAFQITDIKNGTRWKNLDPLFPKVEGSKVSSLYQTWESEKTP